MKNTNRKGFTLIELLVVIAIIGLLSTMAVVSLNSARAKARDAKRVSDAKQMATLLSLAASEIPDGVLLCNANISNDTMDNTLTIAANACADGASTKDINTMANASGSRLSDPNLEREFQKFEDPNGYDSTDPGGRADNSCNPADAVGATTDACQYGLEIDDSNLPVSRQVENVRIVFFTEGQVGDLSAKTVHEISSEGVMVNDALVR